MEPLTKIYMDGTSSEQSYTLFAYKDGVGLGAKLYNIAPLPKTGVGYVLYTRIRVRSAWVTLPAEPETEDDKVVSFTRAKEKSEANVRTMWAGIAWEKIRSDYCSTFIERKAPIGAVAADIEKFLATHTPEGEAKIAAEYLLSLAPDAARKLPVEELAESLVGPYSQVFEGLKHLVNSQKAEAEIDKTTLGTFHMSTEALKQMKASLEEEDVGADDVEED